MAPKLKPVKYLGGLSPSSITVSPPLRRPHRVEHTILTFSAFPLMAQWNSQQFHLRAAWKYEHERDCAYTRMKNHAACALQFARCGLRQSMPQAAWFFMRVYSQSRSCSYFHAARKWNCWEFHCAISGNSEKVKICSTLCGLWQSMNRP